MVICQCDDFNRVPDLGKRCLQRPFGYALLSWLRELPEARGPGQQVVAARSCVASDAKSRVGGGDDLFLPPETSRLAAKNKKPRMVRGSGLAQRLKELLPGSQAC